MSETRPYYSTRQVIDVDSFLSERDTSYVMCVTKAQLHALRVMAKTRLLWPTTWAKERYEQSYLLPDADDWDLIDDHISRWIQESEEVEMCNNALIEALEGISDMIRQSSCCYEAGPGGQYIGEDFYWGTDSPASAPTAFGPGEEFATQEAWESHKCEVANGIINGLIGSLNGMSILTLATLVASSVLAAVVGIGLIFVPPVAIILAILGTGLTFAFFSALATELDTNRESLVCALYSSTTAQEAYDTLKDAIESLSLDAGAIEIQLGFITDLVMQMAPIDTMNALFTSVGLPTIPGTIIDCDTCAQTCPYWEYLYGSGPTLNYGTSITATSEYVPGDGHHRLYVRSNPTECTCTDHQVTITGYTGAIGGINQGNIGQCSGPDLWTYSSGVPALIDTFCCQRLNIHGTGEFTLTFTIQEATCP